MNNNNNEQSNVQIPVNQTIPVVSVNNQPVTQPQTTNQPVQPVIQSQATNQPVQSTIQNPVTQQETTINRVTKTINPQPSVDNIRQKENLKEVKIEKNPKGGNFKYIMVILLFLVLFAMVFYLPEISNFVQLELAKITAPKQDIITTGTLKCKLNNNDTKYDYQYTAEFSFTDSKLSKLNYSIMTKGDEIDDSEQLQKMSDECDGLVEYLRNQEGITISCALKAGTFTKKQVFDYNTINSEKISSVYAEMGGIYPDYNLDDNIDNIESDMKKTGYTCTRYK